MKKILVVCANGVATSTLVANKVKNFMKEKNIETETQTSTNIEVRGRVNSFNPDLIVSNVGEGLNIDKNIPIINGINLLTGMNEQSTYDEILRELED